MGILMERYNLDGDQAFAVLRRYSQDTNTKLRLIAQQLIDTRRLPDQQPTADTLRQPSPAVEAPATTSAAANGRAPGSRG
jgi:hypothetical protein